MIFLLLVSTAILGVSCSPSVKSKSGSQWDHANLQIISTYNERLSSGDFIAGYIRYAGSDIELRFDLLDVGKYPNSDFYIVLDTEPGGTTKLPIQGEADIEWDTLLVFPASGSPKAYSPYTRNDINNQEDSIEDFQFRSDLIPRISRIPWQDYILIAINQTLILKNPAGYKIQAFSTNPGSTIIKDFLGPFRSSGQSPEPAPVILAFWNSFPAYSPAQSLRRWDGAHTGPYGERHGLSILLDNVKRYRVPIFLLDLRNPFAFSTLDYLNRMPLIKELVANKLIILPDAILGSPSYPLFPTGLPDWAVDQYLQDLGAISREFGIPSSQILYSPVKIEEVPGNYSLVISPRSHERTSNTKLNFPYPEQIPEVPQASPDGFPLTIRKLLIENALQINESRDTVPLLVMGGSLPDSAFADPASSAATMSYIANHPWINALSETELLSSPGKFIPTMQPGKTIVSPVREFHASEVLMNIQQPENDSSGFLNSPIWTSALSLYAPLPPESDNLPSLRSNYSGNPGIAQAAISWSNNPQPRFDCQTDPDQDGILECIMASKNQFAVFELDGGRLVAYYNLNGTGIHQIIAPSSQFLVGFGDPTSWIPNAGEGSETAGKHGAFIDSSPPWDFYDVSINGNQLTFSAPDQSIIKTFSLSGDGIQVNYSSLEPISIQIPMAIDPWRRFFPGWRTTINCERLYNGYSCKDSNDLKLEIFADSPITAHSFTDSYSRLTDPEDPNYNYPPGHYLPFPMVLLETSAANSFSIQISISP